jgi:deoxyribodipyrimidine photo-lyase
MAPRLMWFRRDLRLRDNDALVAASHGGAIVPIYILDDESSVHGYKMGAAQKWWLHHSLSALDQDLRGHLILRRGKADVVLRQLVDETGANEIHATRLYEPWNIAIESKLNRVTFHDGDCLIPSEEIRNGSGQPYKVYGAFWSALTGHLPPRHPIDRPARIEYAESPRSEHLSDWKLLPTRPDWANGFGREWTPGEEGGAARLVDFDSKVVDYLDRRDFPGFEGTSRLSPHLHMGEISARQVWHALDRRGAKFLKELAWRDFSRQAMRAQPSIGWEIGLDRMKALHFREGAKADADYRTWTKGLTGYPIVDAGMRQLWATGWMHNRVRMIAASFLTKHLLIHWERGARWFWETLLDADYGNNSLNWQWVAGTGTASQMFNRIMAPLTQSEKFDAGDYIREWIPELAHIGSVDIHDPPNLLRGVYPTKMIGHSEARDRALAALAKARG